MHSVPLVHARDCFCLMSLFTQGTHICTASVLCGSWRAVTLTKQAPRLTLAVQIHTLSRLHYAVLHFGGEHWNVYWRNNVSTDLAPKIPKLEGGEVQLKTERPCMHASKLSDGKFIIRLYYFLKFCIGLKSKYFLNMLFPSPLYLLHPNSIMSSRLESADLNLAYWWFPFLLSSSF